MKSGTKVLFIWEVDPVLKNYLKKVFTDEKSISFIFPKNLSEKNLLKLGKDADIIIGWRQLPLLT
jgi:hypothetical protein